MIYSWCEAVQKAATQIWNFSCVTAKIIKRKVIESELYESEDNCWLCWKIFYILLRRREGEIRQRVEVFKLQPLCCGVLLRIVKWISQLRCDHTKSRSCVDLPWIFVGEKQRTIWQFDIRHHLVNWSDRWNWLPPRIQLHCKEFTESDCHLVTSWAMRSF